MANNGRLLKVRKSDPRYGEEDDALMEGREPRYPHRKPSKASKQRFAAGEVLNEVGILSSPAARAVAGTAAVGLAPRIVRSVPKLLKTAAATVAATGSLEGALGTGAVTLGASGLATLAAAGLGSYFTTKWLIEHFPTKQRRLNAAADAYRKSRQDLAQQLGRALTQSEQKALADHYKQVTAVINSFPT